MDLYSGWREQLQWPYNFTKLRFKFNEKLIEFSFFVIGFRCLKLDDGVLYRVHAVYTNSQPTSCQTFWSLCNPIDVYALYSTLQHSTLHVNETGLEFDNEKYKWNAADV